MLSIIALVVGVIALANRCPTQDLLYKAKNEAMFAEYMSAIDNAFEAV